MIKTKLHENWSMKEANEAEWTPAKVPGTVYADYLAAGKMENPYWRDNELKALELMEHDYIYETTFTPEAAVMDKEKIVLRFNGLDTLADVDLNGVRIGHADNEHRVWEFDVKEVLTAGENTLTVTLLSSVNFIREAFKEDPQIMMSSDGMQGASYLRKAHCDFGWDWGARIPDAGIFKDVELLGMDYGRIESVYVRQQHENGKVTLSFEPEIIVFDRQADYDYTVTYTVTDPEGNVLVTTTDTTFEVPDPQLWWPNGYGAQPLYKVKAVLTRGGAELDRWERRIGLRTMELTRVKDQWGESFCHTVNGVSVFAMGADYIPEDNIKPFITRERTFKLLKDCKDANFNAVRVWGGGMYASEDFLDACDEYGLMVWQDFCFACASYDLTPDFDANIREEFRQNILRMRSHPSLGLWSGNNEMEQFFAMSMRYDPDHKDPRGYIRKASQVPDYFAMYEYILPRMVMKYDPQTPYIPSSPTSGGGYDNPNDEHRGDVHYWDVWHGGKPFTEYRKFRFRYLSEFGFQAFPTMKTIEAFTLPEDRNLFSYVMEKHQRNNNANGIIMRYMQQTYQLPSTFDKQIYTSQMLQAESMRYGVEHFRACRPESMGTIIWQLNDIWPVASWAMIDYYGRWKAVYYEARHFFAPLLLVNEEASVMTQNENINAEPYEIQNSVKLTLCNESMQDRKLTVHWQIREASGEVVRAEEVKDIAVPALSAVHLDEVMIDIDRFSQYVSYQMLDEQGAVVSEGTTLYIQPKYFHFEDPQISLEVLDDTHIRVTAQKFAKNIQILDEAGELKLSDNYFDLQPGSRVLTVLAGKPENLSVMSVYDIR
ncbi:MAG: glycoside hydrolase family 2 protein [Clostridiales bacterium]|nr:glycoside hydrolase family 2 protein [Clostridiales bacterium]